MPALAGTIRFGPGYWPPPPHTPGRTWRPRSPNGLSTGEKKQKVEGDASRERNACQDFCGRVPGWRPGPAAAAPPGLAHAGQPDDHHHHSDRAHPARLLPVHPPWLPARCHRVRRRTLLRQRGPPGARRHALQGVHPGSAARYHLADEPGRAAVLLDRHRLGPGLRPDSHGAGRYRGGRARRAARPPPRAAGGAADVRDRGRLLRQCGGRAHGPRGALARALLPGRRGSGVRR